IRAERAAAAGVALIVGGLGELTVADRQAVEGGGGADRQRAAEPAAPGLQVALGVGGERELQLELILRGDGAGDVAVAPSARGGGRGRGGDLGRRARQAGQVQGG